MWVEIKQCNYFPHSILSSSSWGCELKYFLSLIHHWQPPSSSSWGCELKYFWMDSTEHSKQSSSSWGCELKCNPYMYCVTSYRHPFREDVSWNNLFVSGKITEQGHPLREDVSWNRITITLNTNEWKSSSSWGCELKCLYELRGIQLAGSSSSWGCELK